LLLFHRVFTANHDFEQYVKTVIYICLRDNVTNDILFLVDFSGLLENLRIGNGGRREREKQKSESCGFGQPVELPCTWGQSLSLDD